jgi:hypothetical protein
MQAVHHSAFVVLKQEIAAIKAAPVPVECGACGRCWRSSGRPSSARAADGRGAFLRLQRHRHPGRHRLVRAPVLADGALLAAAVDGLAVHPGPGRTTRPTPTGPTREPAGARRPQLEVRHWSILAAPFQLEDPIGEVGDLANQRAIARARSSCPSAMRSSLSARDRSARPWAVSCSIARRNASTTLNTSVGDHAKRHHVMLSAAVSPSIVNTMIRITGMGDHDRLEWLIRIDGIPTVTSANRPGCPGARYAPGDRLRCKGISVPRGHRSDRWRVRCGSAKNSAMQWSRRTGW